MSTSKEDIQRFHALQDVFQRFTKLEGCPEHLVLTWDDSVTIDEALHIVGTIHDAMKTPVPHFPPSVMKILSNNILPGLDKWTSAMMSIKTRELSSRPLYA